MYAMIHDMASWDDIKTGWSQLSHATARYAYSAYRQGAPVIEVIKIASVFVPGNVTRELITGSARSIQDLSNWAWHRINAELTEQWNVPPVLKSALESLIHRCQRTIYERRIICVMPSGTIFTLYPDDTNNEIHSSSGQMALVQAALRDVAIEVSTDRFSLHDLTEWTPEILSSPRGDEILMSIRNEMDRVGSRAYLLHGPPGTGKSVMAAYLATAIFPDGRVGYLNLSKSVHHSNRPNQKVSLIDDVLSALEYLALDALVIDELDKTTVSTAWMDEIRSTIPLIIYTANNGTDDNIIDSAVVRPGRIDRTFEITSLGKERIIPPEFHGLDSDLVDEILSWPSASINEAVIRASCYGADPDAMGLDEIRTRVEMKCRSVKTGE
jgi:hypothetical protein